MSGVKLDETVKQLERRVTDLEAELLELKEFDTLTKEERGRGTEVDAWVSSGDLSKLKKVK